MRIHVQYFLSETGQKEALRRNLPSSAQQQLEIDDPDNTLLSRVSVDGEGKAHLNLPRFLPELEREVSWFDHNVQRWTLLPEIKLSSWPWKLDAPITNLFELRAALDAYDAIGAALLAGREEAQARLDANFEAEKLEYLQKKQTQANERNRRVIETDGRNCSSPVSPTEIADEAETLLYREALASWEAETQKAAEREAQVQQERERQQQDKRAWIEAQGSDYLRKAFAQEYDCQRLYVTERAASEFPAFQVDFDDDCTWKARSCPSLAALELAESVPGARVVWLTEISETLAQTWDCEKDEYGDVGEAEAVLVTGFLGRYNLLRLV